MPYFTNSTNTRTKNAYSLPVPRTAITKVSHRKSPAHVGELRFSVDFIVPRGTEVHAAADGYVVDLKGDSNKGGDSKYYEPLGNFVEIRHDNDEYSEYEHLDRNSIRVKLGETVRRGQPIALSGATGWLGGLGPHLHFMVGVYKQYRTLPVVWYGEDSAIMEELSTD